jgi:hypothetical protein
MNAPLSTGFTNTDFNTAPQNDTGNSLSNYTNKITVIAGLVFVILVCFFVSLGLYYVISKMIFNQSKIIIPVTKTPIVCTKYTKYSITDYNDSGNGKRRSYTFWIYINDLTKYQGQYQHVFHIGEAGDITSGAPFVFLDKIQNRLYFRMATVQIENDAFNRLNSSKLASVQNLTDTEKDTFMKQGIEIPYVPIQRWVHIAIVINENANGGTITAYVDGDISKIASTGDVIGSQSLNIQNLNLDKKGDLHVGGDGNTSLGPGFSGLISKITMFNYDLNDRDVYDNYNEGPLDGLLASLGLANYGIRSPIYRID